MREFQDGDFPFGAEFTAVARDALDGDGVLTNCGVSVNSNGSLGSGGNALSIASGEVTIAGATISVSSQNADVATADSFKRYDLVTVDDTGTVNVATGASEKVTPAIPAGEVVLSVVEVPASATIADISTTDSRAPVKSPPTKEPMYGGGSDGTVSHSTNQTLGGMINASDYTLESGTTVTVDGLLVITATGKITVNGTFDAQGAGATGGLGGSDSNNSNTNAENGGPGGDALMQPIGSGGSGGGGSGNGGRGGHGDDLAGPVNRHDILEIAQGIFTELDKRTEFGAGGGGGGGPGGYQNTSGDGGNGSAPGGGGGGARSTNSTSGSGGDGGTGGGAVFLIAPEIEVNGTFDVRGTDGTDGNGNSSTGGGGGGGTGGLVYLLGRKLDDSSATYYLSGGAGGTSPTGNSNTGGDGAPGADGEVKRVISP